MNNADLPPLVLIAGPTASGKSALAMALAARRPSVIINADAMQVYRDLRIITARPAATDEAQAPHHLYGHIDAADPCAAPRWATEARAAIAAAHAAGRLPILVGGSGLYIRTLLDGIAPVPPIESTVRRAVRAMPVDEAYRQLAAADPDGARRLAPTDTTRVARALEVVRSTGRPIADWQQDRRGGIAGCVRLAPMVPAPPRAWLAARCDQRLNAIFDQAQKEVAALVRRALDPALPVMRAIGVREIAAFQRGAMTKPEAHEAARLATRQYAKRQSTWFRHQTPADWVRIHEPLDSEKAVQDAILLLVRRLTI